MAGLGLAWANRVEPPLPPGTRVDALRVEKRARKLHVLRGGAVLKSYPIALGRSPVGPKEREGDRRTPEGAYRIDGRKADSAYHRALHISYPEPRDVARGRAGGHDPGGAIMIHGLRNGLGWLGRLHRSFDWTLGCIAVTNPEMDELWRIVPDGTPIELRP